jgi:predicted dinucleotide-binding enzyme
VIGALIAVIAIVGIGTGATARLRTAQLEAILSGLPETEARAYYAQLRRRIRKIAVLRAIALACVVCLAYGMRQLLNRPR